jgi:adenosylhomocysteine nucleosidase
MKRRVLVVAAEQFELAPIRRAVADHVDVDYMLVANGPGPRLAGMAAAAAGPPVAFDAFVSVGLCGALMDGLDIGSIVVGSSINGVEIPKPRVGSGYISGPIASVDYVAGTVEEKRRLRETGAIAVEMEAAAVLEHARLGARPFYCVKAVSDVASEEFVLDLNAARDENGRFNVARILGQAARSPRAALPQLARLKRNAGCAARALGEFFADCNF